MQASLARPFLTSAALVALPPLPPPLQVHGQFRSLLEDVALSPYTDRHAELALLQHFDLER